VRPGGNPPTGGRGGYKSKRQCGSAISSGALACPGASCPGKPRKKGKTRKLEPECCIKSEPENPRFFPHGEGVARLPSNRVGKNGGCSDIGAKPILYNLAQNSDFWEGQKLSLLYLYLIIGNTVDFSIYAYDCGGSRINTIILII
jgi:hypothetical protein